MGGLIEKICNDDNKKNSKKEKDENNPNTNTDHITISNINIYINLPKH